MLTRCKWGIALYIPKGEVERRRGLRGLLACLCLVLMLTLMSALALVFGIGDGANNNIICLPDASEESLLIFVREH